MIAQTELTPSENPSGSVQPEGHEIFPTIKKIIETRSEKELSDLLKTHNFDEVYGVKHLLITLVLCGIPAHLLNIILDDSRVNLFDSDLSYFAINRDCAAYFSRLILEKRFTSRNYPDLLSRLARSEAVESLFVLVSLDLLPEQINVNLLNIICGASIEHIPLFLKLIDHPNIRPQLFNHREFKRACLVGNLNYVKIYLEKIEVSDQILHEGFCEACCADESGKVIKFFLAHERINPNLKCWGNPLLLLSRHNIRQIELFIDDPRVEISSESNALIRTMLSLEGIPGIEGPDKHCELIKRICNHPKFDISELLEGITHSVYNFTRFEVFFNCVKNRFSTGILDQILEILDKRGMRDCSNLVLNHINTTNNR